MVQARFIILPLSRSFTLFGVETSLAVTYAFFVHGGQLVLYVIVGFLSMVLQGSSFSTLRQRTQAAQQQNG